MEKNNNLMSGKGEKGEWKTINGAHVYIEDGQSVEEAMNKQFSKSTSPDKAKSYATGGGHLSENGGYQGVSNVDSAPKFEYKQQSTTQLMKAKLKEAGIDTKHISIREGGGAYSTSYNVKIKSPYIDADEVKKIVNEYESYERDERTGEILEGGNTYVFATYDDSCFDEVSKPYMSKAKGYIDEANAQQDGYGISIKEGVTLFKSGSCCEIFVRNKDSNRQHFRVYDENQLSTFLFQIDQFGKIVH